MKKLQKQFTRKGFTYDLIERKDNIALYSQKTKNGDRLIGFEVFKVQSHNGRMSPDGKVFIEPAEFCPSDTQWGILGWTFYNLEKAKKKFNDLVVL